MNTQQDEKLNQLIGNMIDKGVAMVAPKEITPERQGVLDRVTLDIMSIKETDEMKVRNTIRSIVMDQVMSISLEKGARQALEDLLNNERTNKSLAIRETLQTFADQVGKE